MPLAREHEPKDRGYWPMRNATCIAVFVIIVLVAAQATATTRVYLLAGQSNMEGVGGTDYGDVAIPSPYNVPQTAVHIWNDSAYNGNKYGNAWADLQKGFGDGPNDFGPEVTFGYKLHQMYPNDKIYLIKYAVGATTLGGDWNPNGTGVCYNDFKTVVNLAMANLTTAGLSPKISGMIWMQGEGDCSASYAPAYAANLTNLIAIARSDFATPNMRFALGRILTGWGTDPSYGQQVRAAQMTVPGLVGNAAWINTDDLEINPAQPRHYGTQGQIDLGLRFASAMVPEPSTLILAITGLSAAAGYWRRKRKSNGA
jgi:hypothetical protein